MAQLKTIIVDDEQLARRGLSLRLEEFPEIDVIAQCSNGHEALQAINTLSPDLVFLDIQMPGMNGFDVVANLQSDNVPLIIFVTAFDQYALDAFKVHAIDYVLKPIDDERLSESIERALSQKEQEKTQVSKEKLVKLMMSATGSSAADVEEMIDADDTDIAHYPNTLNIKDGSDIQRLQITDIEWIDAAGDYMCVHCQGKTHIMRKTMKELEVLLNPSVFLRVHRSTIVNINCVAGAQTLNNGEFMLTLTTDNNLKVSRSYRDGVKKLLAN